MLAWRMPHYRNEVSNAKLLKPSENESLEKQLQEMKALQYNAKQCMEKKQNMFYQCDNRQEFIVRISERVL